MAGKEAQTFRPDDSTDLSSHELRGDVGFLEVNSAQPARGASLYRRGAIGRPGESDVRRWNQTRLHFGRTRQHGNGRTETIGPGKCPQDVSGRGTETAMARSVIGKGRSDEGVWLKRFPVFSEDHCGVATRASVGGNHLPSFEEVNCGDRSHIVKETFRFPSRNRTIEHRVVKREEQLRILVDREADLVG